MRTWRKRPRKSQWIIGLKNGPHSECETQRKAAIQAVRDERYDEAITGFAELEEFCRQVGDKVGEQGYKELREECEDMPEDAEKRVTDFIKDLIERGYAGYEVQEA